MKKQKKKSKAIKDLFLDRPTSHGGWPGGHPGSYTDPNTPVNQQIANYLKDMGLADDDNPRARLSENKLRSLIREVLEDNGLDAPDIPGMEHRIQSDARFGEEYRSKGTTTFKDPRHWLAIILKVHHPLDGGVFYDYVITNHPTGTPLYYYEKPKKEFHKKWRPTNVPSLKLEYLSNLPPGTTDSDIDDYFGGPDRPSENADVKDIIEELEETLEEYAIDLGFLPEDDDQALRKTYNSDPGFFDDLYDEIMFNRHR